VVFVFIGCDPLLCVYGVWWSRPPNVIYRPAFRDINIRKRPPVRRGPVLHCLFGCARFVPEPGQNQSSRKPCGSASTPAEIVEGEAALRNPMRGTFVGCCASADAQRARSIALRAKLPSFRLFIFPSRLSPHGCACSVPEPGQNIHLPLSKKK